MLGRAISHRELNTQLYIYAFAIAALAVSVVPLFIWPVLPNTPALWLLPTMVLLIILADHFSIMVSRQADTSLFTVPLFIVVLLGHPSEAALVGAAGVLVSQILAKRPLRAVIFNTGMTAAAGGIAGIVYASLRPDGAVLALTQEHLIAATLAGLALHANNILPVIGIITIRKGKDFWQFWAESYVISMTVDGILLSLGLIAALVTAQASWGIAFMVLPAIGAHLILKNTVEYSAKIGILAEELGERVRMELDSFKTPSSKAPDKPRISGKKSGEKKETSLRDSVRRHLR